MISDSEQLCRAIFSFPNLWNDLENRPTSAVFKDKNGVSVDRDGDRSNDTIAVAIQKRFESTRAHAILSAGRVREFGCKAEVDPLENNPFHALIQGIETLSPTSSQAKRMATNCTVFPYKP